MSETVRTGDFRVGQRVEDRPLPDPAAIMNNARYNFEELKVLVLDDNKNMRALIQSILFALGVRTVLEVGDVAQAFEELKSFEADLIITDWHMEPLDGLDFVRMVRNDPTSPNPYLPIVMLTGHTELQRVVDARDAGVNEFLAKPLSAKALYSRLAAIIDNPRPFIRTKTYFGPCRRRKDIGPPQGVAERRRSDGSRVGRSGTITQEDIESILDE